MFLQCQVQKSLIGGTWLSKSGLNKLSTLTIHLFSIMNAGLVTHWLINFPQLFRATMLSSRNTWKFVHKIGLYDVKKRMFKISVGDCLLNEKVDVLALAGGRLKALNLYFPVKLSNNDVYYKSQKCNGGYSTASKSIAVTFGSVGVDNPMVSAVILFQGTLDGCFIRNWLSKTWKCQSWVW